MKANYALTKMQSKEKADCTVLATQFCLGLSYRIAWLLMAGQGRKPNCKANYRKAAPALGLVPRPDLSCQTLMKALEGMQVGRFVVRVSGHVFAVVDGRMMDSGFPKRGARVKMVYEAPMDDPAFLARYPYLEKLVALEKLPDVWGMAHDNFAKEAL